MALGITVTTPILKVSSLLSLLKSFPALSCSSRPFSLILSGTPTTRHACQSSWRCYQFHDRLDVSTWPQILPGHRIYIAMGFSFPLRIASITLVVLPVEDGTWGIVAATG
jgi:hypothetical protein